jgi:hypothetical protein
MKKFKIIAIVLLCWQMAFAQMDNFTTAPIYQFPTLRISNLSSGDFFLDYLKDEKSADLVKPDLYAGVDGSPYLSEQWVYARIKLADNRIFDSVLLKLNLFENKVYFKDDKNRERQVAVQVKQIEIRDASSDWNNAVFVSGYGSDQNVYYQILGDGKKLGYLKEMKIIIEEHKVFNAPVQKKFELQQGKLCLYAKGVLYEESKNCSSLLSAFGNDNKITSFISSNGIKCSKEKDLKKLVEYYNSY